MQEEVTQKTIALCIRTTKLTADVLKAAMRAYLRSHNQKKQQKMQTQKTGKVTVKQLAKQNGGSFREKTVGACSHSERLLIAVNGLLQVFRQDHRRGIMIRNSSQKRRGWTLSCNQQDFQEICERCEAKHPPVMFPTIDVVWQPGSRGQIRC